MSSIADPRSPVRQPGLPRMPVLKAVTSVRFFAALHVALYHFVRPFTLWPRPLDSIISCGYVGVSFFFFLSGFILTYSHAQEYEHGRGDPKEFWIARFARIYPVYFLSMLLAAYVNFAEFVPRIHIVAYVADLLMLQSWSMRLVNFFHVTAWSLSDEMFFYLVFPFLLLPLRPRTKRSAYLVFAGLWLLMILAPVISTIASPQSAFMDMPYAKWTLRVERLPLFSLPEFLAGMALGWIYLKFRPSRKAAAWLGPAGIAAYLACLAFSQHIPHVLILGGIFIPLYAMILTGLSEQNWMSRLMSGKTLVLLGEASYSLYLFHFLFNDWTKTRFGAGTGLLSAAWKLAVVIAASIALHIWVERPGRRLILKRFGNRPVAARP